MSALHFKKTDEEQSEVWRDGQDHRLIATEGIKLVVQQICEPSVFESFWKSYPTSPGEETSLEDPNVDAIAAQLELR